MFSKRNFILLFLVSPQGQRLVKTLYRKYNTPEFKAKASDAAKSAATHVKAAAKR